MSHLPDFSPSSNAKQSDAGNMGLAAYERLTSELREAAPGMTAGQLLTFLVVIRKGRCNQTEIGNATGLGKAAVSRHVLKLVALGLLSQSVDPTNGRKRVVSLTDRGRHIPR